MTMIESTEPDEILTAALAEHGSPLTGDQYVEHVLAARQSAWITDHEAAYAARGVEPTKLWAPLLPDFVLDADADHVQVPERAPRPPRQQRMDTRLERYTRLQARHVHAQQMLAAAEAREACQTDRR